MKSIERKRLQKELNPMVKTKKKKLGNFTSKRNNLRKRNISTKYKSNNVSIMTKNSKNS